MNGKKSNNIFFQCLKIISNVISWVLLILLVIIAGFLVYYFIATNTCNRNSNRCEPKISLYTIISPSMTPTIKVYDVIINLKTESSDEINVGDIITFHSTSKLYSSRIVTHRVIEKRTNENGTVEFKTQGDNNLSPDDTYVPYENLIGKVIFKIPQLGRVQFLLTSVGGWLFFVIVPALILVLLDVLKLFKLFDARKKIDKNLIKEQVQNSIEQQNLDNIRTNLKKKYMSSIKYQKSENENVEIIPNTKKKIVAHNEELREKYRTVPTITVKYHVAEIKDTKKKIVKQPEIELPKLIKVKAEEIPNELELPVLEKRPQKVVSTDKAKK